MSNDEPIVRQAGNFRDALQAALDSGHTSGIVVTVTEQGQFNLASFVIPMMATFLASVLTHAALHARPPDGSVLSANPNDAAGRA